MGNNNSDSSKYNINNQMLNNWTIDTNFDKKLNATTQAVEQSVDNLRTSTIDARLSAVWTNVDLTTQKAWIEYSNNIRSLVWFLSSTDRLLEEIKNIKSWISKKWLDKAQKQAMNNAKFTLNEYEKRIKNKQRALNKQKWPITIYDGDIKNLQDIRWNINKLKEDLAVKWQWSKQWNPGLPYNSIRNAAKSNERQIDMLRFNQNLQEEAKQWAILRIFNWHAQNLTDFYRRIAQWEYTQADYELYTRNISILWPSLQRCGITTPILVPNQNMGVWWAQIEQWFQQTSPVDYSDMSLWEAFQRWWIAWVIDKWLGLCKNMSPWQRNTWRNLAVLWGVAAWLFWLYKFYTNKNMWFRGKAWITAAVIFWSQALTWEWPISLFNKLLTWWFTKEWLEDKFWNTFWDAVNWIWNSWVECSSTITPAMYSMMIFNSSTKVSDVRDMTNNFKADQNAWKTFRWEAITKLKDKYWDRSVEHFSATFDDNFDEEKRNNWLASFWVTDSTNNNKRIYELANNATMNEIILEKFRTEHWVKETSNVVKKKELDEYINNLKKTNQAIDITVLESHPEWFELDKNATYTERPEDIQFKENISNQIEWLSIDDQKKSKLQAAVKRFYDERTIDTKPRLSDFSLSDNNGLIVLTSNSWQKAKIDIDKWELVNFWKGIRFSELSELLSVADLANKVLDTQKWKIPKDLPPFQYKKRRKWICFNDASSIWQDIITRNNSWMDTRVLSTWRRWATSKIDNLYENSEAFAQYLSDRWIDSKKNDINLTRYPIINWLFDSWIVFVDEQEVKQAEIRLNKVKEMRSTSNGGTTWYKPFSIEWNKLVFSTSDTKNATKLYFPDQFPNNFPGKSQDLSSFPSIIRNKTAFLNYMNDKKNWMRWSKLNQ